MKTVVISIRTSSGNRYFNKFGKKKRITTAWSLAGAEMFLEGHHKLNSVVESLTTQGKNFEIFEVVELRKYESAPALNSNN